MRKLKSIYKKHTSSNVLILKVWECKDKLRGEIYNAHQPKEWVQAADFKSSDGDMNESRVLEYFGFTAGSYTKIPFERKNGKIVLYPVNKQKRIIWSNDNYDEWKQCLMEDGEDEESLTYERYYGDCDMFLDDERGNLDIEVDGYIVAFASLGLWDGRINGAKTIGSNVKQILHSNCDSVTWYCDVYNVRCEAIHHDGTNYLMYRVAKDKDEADRLAYKIAYEDMTEEQFRKATKSLRPYIAKVYGW